MGKFRGLDKDEGWIKRRFAKIEKQMREDRAAKRLQASTIGAGGITLKDGGAVDSHYTAALGGGTAAHIGPIAWDPSNPTSSGTIIYMLDEHGSNFFQVAYAPVSPTFPTGYSVVFGQAQNIDFRSATYQSQLFIDDTQAYLLSSNQVHLYGTNGTTIQHGTTGSAANAVLDAATGLVSRSTSSLRYKQDVEDAEVDPAAVLDMQPRTWRDKAEVEKDPDTETRYVGFIAEELHDLGLGQFVVYDADGDPEAISYDRLTVALLAVLKDQEKRIAALEADDA